MDNWAGNHHRLRIRHDGRAGAARTSAPSLDTKAIFRQLIEEEIRSGRLTRSRRKRIIRYAAQLQLSAVEAGRLIEQSKLIALRSDDPTEHRHALRLAAPESAGISTTARIWLVVIGAIVLDGWVLWWVW